MKNKITLLALTFLFVITIAKAQTVVPNANMESWVHTNNYDNPVSWSTPNSFIPAVFKDSDNVFDGNYSARLVCTSIIGIIVPGIMTTGVISVDIASQSYSFIGGSPITDSDVTAMIGYYQYSGVGIDSCLMYCTLTKWNTLTSKRDTVAITAFVSGSTTGYTFFASPFTWLLPSEKPDTAQIILLTTANYTNAAVGSTLWVDDIDFTNSVGISNLTKISIGGYPNPADASFTISLPQELNAQSITVTNVAGTIVKQLGVASTSEAKINTAPYAEGTYVAFVKNKEGKVVASGKFTVKH